MNALLREPLLHFLVLGVGLFVVHGALNRSPADGDSRTIVVDREKLLTYVQFRSRVFDGRRFNDLLDRLPHNELQALLNDYVREEALYREAKALRLDRNDYISRLRLIQQLEFVTRGFADERVKLTDQEVERYYQTHGSDYAIAPRVTFTHVFFSRGRHGEAQAEALARAELSKLNRAGVRFDQAPGHGERFLYQVNYVGSEPQEIASHFGSDMQRELFALEPNQRNWRGPLRSPYGYHLVLVARAEAGHVPPFEEIRERVEGDARHAALDARFEETLQAIVKAYKVKVVPIQTHTRERAVAKAPS